RAAQRKSLISCETMLKQSYRDLERNITYLKQLEADIAGHVQFNTERDAYIANLLQQLERQSAGSVTFHHEAFKTELGPLARQIRRLVVAKFHPRLLPE